MNIDCFQTQNSYIIFVTKYNVKYVYIVNMLRRVYLYIILNATSTMCKIIFHPVKRDIIFKSALAL